MTDEYTEREGMKPDGFDDDRLLALALGLDDDPDLQAAAADDAALAARLAAMRADVAAIGAQVSAAVPAPEESYTDLSGARWSGLKEFFEPAPAAKPRRELRWWRVVAPLAALAILALFVGIIAVNGGGGSSSSGSSGEAQTADQAAVAQSSSGAGFKAVEPQPESAAERLVDQLDRFGVVVLARARRATGILQRFAVLRIFKGDAPRVVELEVDGKPADAGRLHLLMLDPVAAPPEDSASPQESATPGSPVSPEPLPSLAAAKGHDLGLGEPLTVAYTYQGEPTMVREFAAGTDPSTVSLPIP
jgi:anti-sigma-K factor RskA